MKQLPAKVTIHGFLKHRRRYTSSVTIVCLCCHESFIGDPYNPACLQCHNGRNGPDRMRKAVAIHRDYEDRNRMLRAAENDKALQNNEQKRMGHERDMHDYLAVDLDLVSRLSRGTNTDKQE